MRAEPMPGGLFRLLHKDARVRLDELTDFALVEGPREEIVAWFADLCAWLRPRAGQTIDAKVRFLGAHLEQHPDRRARTAAAFTRLVEGTSIQRFLVAGGIPHDFHLGGAIKEWLAAVLLPSACDTDDGAEVLRIALRLGDLSWVGHQGLFQLLADLVRPDVRARLGAQLDEALVDLAHQIVAQARLPGMRRLQRAQVDPFASLFARVADLARAPQSLAALASVRACVRESKAAIEDYRSHLAERGADMQTTFLLGRLHVQLRRLDGMARVLHRPAAAIEELPVVVRQVLRHARGDRLLSRSTELVTQNIVDTAADVGQKYLDEGRASYRAAFLAGAGGGALMALATFAKLAIVALHLPVLYEGIVASLNYATTFCVAYLLHFTIATKLPAHTAATLARSVGPEGGFGARVDRFVAAWRSALKLQIAGLLGNVLVAGPLAYAVAVGFREVVGRSFIGPAKAASILQAHDVFGPSVLYAALAGAFLWASSLVGALADGWVRVHRLADRVATSRFAMKRFGGSLARRIGDGIAARWGGLASNVSLGFMLGSIPAAFAILQLPVEIRHVTVATASVAVAFASGAGPAADVARAISGVAAIALANVAVSFVLALWFAMRGARGSASAGLLIRVGLTRWARNRSRPTRTARPPASTVDEPVPA